MSHNSNYKTIDASSKNQFTISLETKFSYFFTQAIQDWTKRNRNDDAVKVYSEKFLHAKENENFSHFYCQNNKRSKKKY